MYANDIFEALNDHAASELVAQMRQHVRDIPNSAGYSIVVEEGGRMVILITDWSNREDCVTYHTSKASRQFVGGTLLS